MKIIAYFKAEKNCHVFYLSVFQDFFSPLLLLLLLLLFFMIGIDVGQFVGVTHTDKGWRKMKKCNKQKKLSIIESSFKISFIQLILLKGNYFSHF